MNLLEMTFSRTAYRENSNDFEVLWIFSIANGRRYLARYQKRNEAIDFDVCFV